jgi:hypothetical protein
MEAFSNKPYAFLTLVNLIVLFCFDYYITSFDTSFSAFYTIYRNDDLSFIISILFIYVGIVSFIFNYYVKPLRRCRYCNR